MGKLTALQVKNATKPGNYHDGDGLILTVKPSGARSWLLRVQVGRKRREVGLGSASAVTLADARAKAAAERMQWKAGVDTLAERRAAKLRAAGIPTFREAALAFHTEHSPSWRNVKHRADWTSSLESYAFPLIGNTKVDALEVANIRDVLARIWLDRPETARRVRQRLKAVLGYAAAKGYRQPLDFDVVSHGLPKQPKKGHFAAMPYEDVPAFVAGLLAGRETMGRKALAFTILTAARSGEVRGATWGEIDFDKATWTISGERMKAGRTHVVPLSAPALAILKGLGMGKPGEVIFASAVKGPLSDMALSKVVRDAGLGVTVHGFRSSFKDWASEETSFPDAVSEAALAHGDEDKTRAAYRRTDFRAKRVALMAAWGDYCTGRQGGEAAGPADVKLAA